MKTGNENGFTLIELLIAITLLAIGLLALSALQVSAIRGNGFAMRNTTATALIEQKLDDIRATPFASINDGTVIESNLGQGGVFTRTATVAVHPVFGSQAKDITVTVAWTDFRPHSISVKTVISD